VGGESLPTQVTGVGLLTRVYPLVGDERPLLGEGLAAVVAAVVTNAQVSLLVCEHARALEDLAADVTLDVPVTNTDAGRVNDARREILILFPWPSPLERRQL